jgi:hypothetical protein
MKRHLNLLNTLVFITLLSLPAFSFAGNGDEVEKKKAINKSYTVTASDKLNIENSFGNVVINIWDKNEIKVDIDIAANGSTEERAQKILDEIEVTESRSGSNIYFKTDVGEIHNNGGHHKDKGEDGRENNRTFHIDYVVYMPKMNPLKIENSFGKITVPDLGGLSNLTSKFGGLIAGKLDNVEAIDVEFGTADIAQVRNGKVTFKFDSKSHIDKISGSVRINSEFSGNVQLNIQDNIEELTLNESYSKIRMIATKELSANFDIHTSFGSFHNSSDFKISEDRDDNESGPRFDKDYTGKAGDGKAKIKIKSSFGSVRLSHTADKDSDDDREERTERKERKERKEKKEKEEVSF